MLSPTLDFTVSLGVVSVCYHIGRRLLESARVVLCGRVFVLLGPVLWSLVMQRLTVPRYVHAADLPYERSIYKTRVTVGAQGMLTLQCSTKTQLLGAYSQLSGRLQISYCNLAFLGIR